MKFIKAFFFCFTLLGVTPVFAQAASPTIPGWSQTTGCPGTVKPCFVPPPVNPMASDSQYTVTPTVSTALTVPSGALGAFITVENNTTYSKAIRCTFDGTTPTASVGHEFAAGTAFWIARPYLSTIKCIQEASAAAFDVTYAN